MGNQNIRIILLYEFKFKKKFLEIMKLIVKEFN